MPRTTSVNPAGVEINGPRVRHLRQLRGESMTDFANRCNIGYSYLSHIERGRRPTVSPAAFARICNGLDIAEDERVTLMPPAARRRIKAAAA